MLTRNVCCSEKKELKNTENDQAAQSNGEGKKIHTNVSTKVSINWQSLKKRVGRKRLAEAKVESWLRAHWLKAVRCSQYYSHFLSIIARLTSPDANTNCYNSLRWQSLAPVNCTVNRAADTCWAALNMSEPRSILLSGPADTDTRCLLGLPS